MLHILGNEVTAEPVEPGYLSTNQEFENVHIRVEYKWGVKRFAPRSESKRDNGILYGLVGEDKVWPRMVECQIEEGDVGDYFLVDGVRGIQARHDNGLFGQGLAPNGWATAPATKPGEVPPEPTTGRKIKDGNFENLDEWNVVEVIWQGDRSGAHREWKDSERSVDAAAARSAKRREVHPINPRENRHRNRIRRDMVPPDRSQER